MDFNEWNTFWTVCFGVMALFIIVGNTLSIVILSQRTHRKRPHFLLISLAIADLLVGLCAIPIYISLYTVKMTWLMRLIDDCVDMFTGLSSIFTLAVISLERLNAIARPFHHRQLTLRSYVIAIATPWIFSLMVTATRVFNAFSILTMQQFLYVVIASLSTPLLIVCISYYLVWRKQVSRIHNETQARHEIRLSRTLLLITAVFILSWLPFQVLMIIVHMCIPCKVPGVVVFAVKVLQYSNSFINFVIYCVRMPSYRNAVLQMLPLCKCSHNRNRVLYPLTDNGTAVALISFKRNLHFAPPITQSTAYNED